MTSLNKENTKFWDTYTNEFSLCVFWLAIKDLGHFWLGYGNVMQGKLMQGCWDTFEWVLI